MKSTVVVLSGGSSVTDIPCTIAAHHVRVTELLATPVGLVAEFPDDDYATTREYAKGAAIRRSGHGYHGILARPANYNFDGTPTSAELYMKVKAVGDSATAKVLVEEFESGESIPA